MKSKFFYKLTISLLFVVSLFGCTTNAIIDVNENSSGTFIFNTSASSGVENIVRSFTGAGESVNVFDKNLIQEGFDTAGLTLLSFDATGNADISLSGKTTNINKLVPSTQQLITFENSTTKGSLSLHINSSTINSLLSLMGEENLVYLELLQAPIFTGFPMSTEEYLSFIGALYGQTMLDELKSSNVSFELIVPRNIKAITLLPSNIGKARFSQKTATVTISLADFLANTSDIALNITW